MKILITGAKGRLGSLLVDQLRASHDVVGLGRSELDITNFEAVKAIMHEHQPDLVIHPAAWTDVNGCAENPEKAIVINGFGTQNLAVATAQVGAGILYVSSNEVFDGKSILPYREYDRTQPINPYGYSKWVGEEAVQTLNPKHYIVRTAWLFAHGGRNFIHAILGAVEADKPLRVVINEVANPTYTNDVAEAIAKLIKTERYGIYHFVNDGFCSRWDFARYVLDKAGYADVPIAKITAQEWKRPSTPPEYGALANMAGKSIGIELRAWQEAVDAFLEQENLLND